jgi:hypothetical protein
MTLTKTLIGCLFVALALAPMAEAGRSGGISRDSGTLQPGFPVHGNTYTYKTGETATFTVRTNNPAAPISVVVKSTPGNVKVASGTTGADGSVTVSWVPTSAQRVQNFYISVTNVGSVATRYSSFTN